MSGTLTVTSDAFKDGNPIPEKYAFCAPCAEEHSKMSTNISPALTWSAGPEGTKSYAIICVDVDVPTIFDNINTEGKTIPADQPRQDFFHGLLVDVSANRTNLAEGEESGGLVAKGKPIGRVPHGVRESTTSPCLWHRTQKWPATTADMMVPARPGTMSCCTITNSGFTPWTWKAWAWMKAVISVARTSWLPSKATSSRKES